jgi:anti-sigma B factor antagonist
MHSELLDLQISYLDGSAIITASGEIDAYSAVTLDAALNELGSGVRGLLDLSDVQFIDSSGLRVLMLHSLGFRENGGSLAIIEASAAVFRVATLAGVDGLLERAKLATRT